MTPRWQTLAPIILVLLAAFALRLWHLDTEPIWHDEAWSIRAFRGPFTMPDDNTPFIYYLAGHLLWRGAGESPLALRFLSVLLGTLTAALTLRVGARWFGMGAGLAAGVLVAASPLLWEYAQEVRAYVAVPIAALGTLIAADWLLRAKHSKRVPSRVWAFAFIVQLAALYTHNLGVPLVVWLNAALGIAWLLRSDFRKMITWAAVEIALIAAYVPWLLTQSPSGTPLNTPPGFDLSLVETVWTAYVFPVQAQLQDVEPGDGLYTASIVLGALVVLLGAWLALATLRRGDSRLRQRAWLLISHALLVPVFTTGLMLAAHIDFHPRYYIAAVPGTLLMAVGGAAALGHLRALRMRTAAFALLAIAGVALGEASILQIRQTRAYQHNDFRALAAYYATLPADAAILIPFDVERALQDYYGERMDIQASFVNVPLYTDETTAREAINKLVTDSPRHVELLTWFQLPADPRGMYPCLLRSASSAVGEDRRFFGLSTQAYTLTSRVTMQPIDAEPTFRGADYLNAAYASGPAGTCLRSTWRLPETTDADLSVSAALLNPLGGTLNSTDAALARDDNAPTSAWRAGDTGRAYALLTPPQHTPPGTYDATLGLYSDAQPNGYDVLDAAGNPAGKRAQMADAVSLPAGNLPPIAEAELHQDDVPPDGVPSGTALNVTLLLPESDSQLSVTLRGEGWSREASVPPESTGALYWQRFHVPPDATGDAELTVGSKVLETYTIEAVDRQMEPPDYATNVAVRFPGVGELVGVTTPDVITSDDAREVTLVWRGLEGEHETNYTVFVQLISTDGHVIAQDDSQPAGGNRPTTGWVPGEYITDTHHLTFNQPDYSGEAYLIAGLYDADSDFRRVRTADGEDHARLKQALPVNNLSGDATDN